MAKRQKVTITQHMSESVPRSCSDAGCLACLDFGRELPCLPDDAKEAIAQHLNMQDLSRCLLVRKSSSCWLLSKHYLSWARLDLQRDSVIEETQAMQKALSESLACLKDRPDALTCQNSVSELERKMGKGCDAISCCAVNAQLQIDRILSAGCSARLCSSSWRMQEDFKILLSSRNTLRQLMMDMKVHVLVLNSYGGHWSGIDVLIGV